MATDDDVRAIDESAGPLCFRCRASFPRAPSAFCDECIAILDGTVTDWQDDTHAPLQFPPPSHDRPAA
jgi:predicted amidophosphoribosyltransferase